jgi:nucleotide-binding universal stress UspA family protein
MKKQKSTKRAGAAGRISATSARAKVQKILVTTDFSNQALPAVRYALAFGSALGASVTLLHVIEPASPMAGMESLVLARTDSEVEALAGQELEALARRESKGNVKMTTMVRSGKPFHEIALVAGERRADLIVIATHGHTGLERVMLGSTAERVVRHAPCPVLTIPTRNLPKRAKPAAPLKLKKILVPIDFSSLSKDALPYALLLAGHADAELVLVHIVEKYPMESLLGPVTNELTVPWIKQAEANLEDMASDLIKTARVKAKAMVQHGAPFEAICDAAKTVGADMIVLTTHGYTGLRHVWLGSTAERVVRHAPCPVMVVRELEH